MLRADLHVHTRYSPDGLSHPKAVVARCQRVGLNCLAVTDHNTIRGALAVRELAPFMVIVGEEIRTSRGEVTGLFLQEEVPSGLAPGEAARRVKEQGGLVSIPHPFDTFRRGSALDRVGLEEVLPYADVVEAFNARNVFAEHDRAAQRLASERGLLVSAVSDAHTLGELGHTYVEMPEFDGTPEGFKAALAQCKLVTRRASRLVHLSTTIAKLRRLWR
ncbi:MAG: PHP domain-containing protein [Chloroflexi bacterium]|nr:PHP domain-containing protein [Chloroflexota bacterium]